jgi:hypothetical protein
MMSGAETRRHLIEVHGRKAPGRFPNSPDRLMPGASTVTVRVVHALIHKRS